MPGGRPRGPSHGPSYAHRMTTVADVLALLRRDPGRPRLTWYGPEGERVELSGHVLDNWVTKTANLLVEELDAGPGTRVALELPAHWRTVVWALATWRVGATAVLLPAPTAAEAEAGHGTDADVLVTTLPREGAVPAQVAVALPALARRFPDPLPAGALDAASSVMTYGDVLGWVPTTDPGATALDAAGAAVTHERLVGWASTPPAPAQARVLLEPHDDAVAPVLAAVLGALAADGSVVLCAPDVVRELAADPGRRERLVASERVTDA